MKFAFLLAVSVASLTALMCLNVLAFAQRDTCCCPIPVGDTTAGFGRRIPPYADLMPRLSPDGKHLAIIDGEYDSAWVIDLTTLERKPIVIHTGLPQVPQTYTYITWCPYDPDLLAISVDLEDTFYNAGIYGYGNIYTYRLSSGECHRITPQIFGPVGDTSEIIGLSSWRENSHSGSDTLEVSSWRIQRDSTLFFIPQTQAIFRTPWYGNLLTFVQSRSGKHSLLGHNWYPTGSYYLNDSSLTLLDSSIESLDWASFSPNEKLLTLSVRPNGQGPPADTVFPQVWVYRVDSMSAPPIVINFQKSFCMYSFWGIDAEFITDSTLAVSMHKDGDESSPLWEITLDGRIKRQLTFLPEWPDGILEHPMSISDITLSPNPTTDYISIRGGSGTVTVTNVIGESVMHDVSSVKGGGDVELDLSRLPAGTYFARIETLGGMVVRKILKE